jgi:UDP-N-acetylmuramate--alanine ligase
MSIKNYKHIHFIGISGISMSGLAKYILQKYPYIRITGNTNISDYQLDNISINIPIEQLISTINICVYTSAIKKNHPELEFLLKANIPILHRSELLALLTKDGERITIVGSHGKTSITSYAHQLLNSLNPTTFIGGILDNGESFSLGNNLYIVEGDESDKSFLNLPASYTIIPNFDDDHLENYNDSLLEYYETFKKYIVQNIFDHKYIICGENLPLKIMIQDINMPINYIFYGLEKDNHVIIHIIESVQYLKWKIETDHEALTEIHNKIFHVENIFGIWNILNITSVIILATLKNIHIKEQIVLYKPKRRLEIIYTDKYKTMIIDDYAVHPTEIENVLESCLQKYGKDIYVIWQPHRYSRLKRLKDKFTKVFQVLNSTHFFYITPYEVENIISVEDWPKYITYGTFVPDILLKNLLTEIKGKIILLLGAGDLNKKVLKILN